MGNCVDFTYPGPHFVTSHKLTSTSRLLFCDNKPYVQWTNGVIRGPFKTSHEAQTEAWRVLKYNSELV